MLASFGSAAITSGTAKALMAAFGRFYMRLKHFGIEYHKFLVPGTNASQIFLYDPEGKMLPRGMSR